MPGSIIFKPLEVNLSQDKTLYGKPDPYCVVSLGDQKIQTQVGEKTDTLQEDGYLSLQVDDESTCLVELKDHDNVSLGEKIGSCHISLDEIETKGSVKRWYAIYDEKDHTTGKILLEAIYKEENQSLTDIPSSPESGLTSPEDCDEETLDLESKGTREGQDKEKDPMDEQLSPLERFSRGKENKERRERYSFDQEKRSEDDKEECKVEPRGFKSESKSMYEREYENYESWVKERSPEMVQKGIERAPEKERKGTSLDKDTIETKWDV